MTVCTLLSGQYTAILLLVPDSSEASSPNIWQPIRSINWISCSPVLFQQIVQTEWHVVQPQVSLLQRNHTHSVHTCAAASHHRTTDGHNCSKLGQTQLDAFYCHNLCRHAIIVDWVKNRMHTYSDVVKHTQNDHVFPLNPSHAGILNALHCTSLHAPCLAMDVIDW